MEKELIKTTNQPINVRKVPTLSLGDYTDGTEADQIRFIDNLFMGIKDYGFIILKDHGIENQVFDQAYELLGYFYRLPIEVKLKYVGHFGGQRGYTPFGQEHAKGSPVMDLKEFFHVGREVSPGHQLFEFYKTNIWPEEMPQFKPLFSSMYQRLDDVGRTMLQALTFPLDVDIQYFDRMTEDGNSILRLLHYPPIPNGVDPRCVRAAAHGDINLITLLPAATASGLQLKDRNGEWLDVEGRPGELIVDAGDMLSRITNEVIPSTIHQVVNTPEATYSSRYSMPFFMHPNPNALLSCIPSCRGEKALYPDITANDFLVQRLIEIGLIKQ